MIIPYLILIPACIYYGRKMYGGWGGVIGLVVVTPLILMLVGPLFAIPVSMAMRFVAQYLASVGIELSADVQMTLAMSIAALACVSILRWYALEDERGKNAPPPEAPEPKPYQPETPPSKRTLTMDEQIELLRAEHNKLKEKDGKSSRQT